jgi:hypothetical protein
VGRAAAVVSTTAKRVGSAFYWQGAGLSLAIPGGSRQLDRAVLHEGFSGGQYYARQSVLVRPEHVQLTAEGLVPKSKTVSIRESAIYWIYVWRTGNR